MGGTRFAASLVLVAAACVAAGTLVEAGRDRLREQDARERRAISFNRDVRPIVSENCFSCHGPDESKRKTTFRLDTRDGAFVKAGIIVPGNAGESMLMKRVTATVPIARMPPPDSGYALTPAQIDVLRRWIDEGAKWDSHWAFVPPVRPEPPRVERSDWVRNPIDQFILARLEREGLKPSREADKATLLRRVTHDLTGLPPTPAAIDAFVADKSPDAYEKRVDALLRSPQHGERMAIPWLDTARYADTHGYHIDSHRDMWPWRDWVINAFNTNLPFDRFIVEQLAGDLLPTPTREQRIATGFNRNHIVNFEGGAIADEYQVEYVVDRVEATSTTFLGLTMGCARCHSHKFDPISHREFYQFYAFFNSVAEKGLDGREGNAVPILELPTPEQERRLATLEAAIEAKEAELGDAVVGPLQEEWERTTLAASHSEVREGLAAHYELDGSFSDLSGGYRHGRTIGGDPTFDEGRIGGAVTFDGDTHVSFGDVGGFERSDPFTLAVWVKGRGSQPMTVFQKLDDRGRGYLWRLDDLVLTGIQRRAARLTVTIASGDGKNAVEVRTRERLQLGEWHHVTMVYDGSGKAAGLVLFKDGARLATEVVRDALKGSIGSAASLQVGDKALGPPFRGQLDDLRLYTRALALEEIERLAIHYPARAIVSGVGGKPSEEEAERVRDYFLTYAAPAPLRAAHRDLASLRRDRAALKKTLTTTMVMAEMEKPRDTFVLERGDYRNHGEKVRPGVPAVLPPLPKDAPANRLTLARWLVDPKHPLTARVAVNRFWQMYFGFGITKTQEDFGVRGEAPVHPELLDWLATEFIRSNWDVRAMQRLIVTSAAYRQSSKVTRELLERDPENRLLARGPRVRLPAEMIRDTALAASGLLNPAVGGPSVLPYQPPGLWEELAFGDGFSAQSYQQGKGKDLYRRGLYTFWKRTVAPATLATFDAPDREKCTARRTLTNTPLQALALMNDPTFVEAARVLAQRALTEAGDDANGRIAHVFRLVNGRKPTRGERRVLRSLLDERVASFRRDRGAAVQLLDVGDSAWDKRLDPSELAAWTTVASVVLNLDETITKE